MKERAMIRQILFFILCCLLISGCSKREPVYSHEEKIDNTMNMLESRIEKCRKNPNDFLTNRVLPAFEDAKHDLKSGADKHFPLLLLAHLRKNVKEDRFLVILQWLGTESEVTLIVKTEDGAIYGRRHQALDPGSLDYDYYRLATFQYDRGIPFDFSQSYKIGFIDKFGNESDYIDVDIPQNVLEESAPKTPDTLNK